MQGVDRPAAVAPPVRRAPAVCCRTVAPVDVHAFGFHDLDGRAHHGKDRVVGPEQFGELLVSGLHCERNAIRRSPRAPAGTAPARRLLPPQPPPPRRGSVGAAAPTPPWRRHRSRRPAPHGRFRSDPARRAVDVSPRAGSGCSDCTKASVEVRSAGALTSTRSAAISSSSSSAMASRPAIGTAGAPGDDRASAWRRAAANGPPIPNPVRSALFKMTTVGMSDPLTASRSSGLSASAITSTVMSAVAPSAVTATPASANAADTVVRPTPSSTVHRNTHGRTGAPDNRCQPRIAALLSESRQGVDENLAASMSPRGAPRSVAPVPTHDVGTSEGVPRAVVVAVGSKPATRWRPVPVEGNCWVSICTTMRVLHP